MKAITSVGIVGHGAFGTLLEKLLRRFVSDAEIRVFDHRKKGASLKEVAQSDVVFLAVPIAAFEDVLKKVLLLAPKDTVLVDVATVKVHTANLLKKMAKGRRYIATHPVWGPESYEKRGGNVSGFRIVIVDHTLPQGEYAALTSALRTIGFEVVETSAEAHDRHLAETLFLTHFVGQLITRAGFGRTPVDTVSYGFLMDAVESVRKDEKLFHDVYRFNPYCKEVLERISKAESSVRSSLQEGGVAKRALTIGISGAKGSFSEEAAREYAKRSALKKYELRYLISVENVLAALDRGEIDLGIFPIQNSSGGIVSEAVKPMSKYDFKIRKVFDIDVRQNLIVERGTTAKQVKNITSHEQALKQCKAYLKREWPKAKIKKYEDTAKAAADLASGKLAPTTAVIASRAAAAVYKLKILAAGVQDLKTNFTTFIAASRR